MLGIFAGCVAALPEEPADRGTCEAAGDQELREQGVRQHVRDYQHRGDHTRDEVADHVLDHKRDRLHIVPNRATTLNVGDRSAGKLKLSDNGRTP